MKQTHQHAGSYSTGPNPLLFPYFSTPRKHPPSLTLLKAHPVHPVHSVQVFPVFPTLSAKRMLYALIALGAVILCPLSEGNNAECVPINSARVGNQPKELNWIEATDSAPWMARELFASVSFNNKIWVMGGLGFEETDLYIMNDVWSSSDGQNWIQITDDAPWSPRDEHGAVVYDNKMWILGGGDNEWYLNDVWYSPDGVNWFQATDDAQWSPRSDFRSLVFDDKMWIIGGYNWEGIKNDVWYSSDGVDWTQATDNAEWGILDGYSTAVFQDKMWVMGGYNHTGGYLVGDVWSSNDGAHWMYSGDCGWRGGQMSLSAGGGIWLMGGNYHGYLTNGVWYSQDGTNWTLAGYAGWTPRGSFSASVAFDGKLWILGGWNSYADHPLNDVWYAEVFNAHFSANPGIGYAPLSVQFTDESISVVEPITRWLWDFGDGNTSTEQHPAHTYRDQGLYDVSLTVTAASGADTETKTGCIHVTAGDRPFHTADINQDHKISLSELLRIIQFYNLDGLHCAPASEDGYAPQQGDTSCDLHSSDYNPPDWRISMSELLRAIQLFRSPSYQPCSDGEDGFYVE